MLRALMECNSPPSLPGLCTGVEVANKGQIRFVRRGPRVVSVTLTISYELPDVLVPFANVRRDCLLLLCRIAYMCRFLPCCDSAISTLVLPASPDRPSTPLWKAFSLTSHCCRLPPLAGPQPSCGGRSRQGYAAVSRVCTDGSGRISRPHLLMAPGA